MSYFCTRHGQPRGTHRKSLPIPTDNHNSLMNKQEQRQLLRQRGICAVIPTYNNAATVVQVVRQTLEECADVIVVCDGCTDATDRLVGDIGGITVVSYPRNRGKGHALREGFRKARQMGFAYAITLDADGQHYPSDIARLLEANLRHPHALIVGSRQMQGADRSRGSRMANRLANFWFSVQTGLRLDDTQTGYRLYPLRHLSGLSLITSRYEAELELLVLAAWKGTRIVSVPVGVYYPPRAERVSHFRPVSDFLRISLLNCVLCLLALVYGLPRRLLRAALTLLRTTYALLFFLFFIFAVITPWAWIYTHMGPMTERKRMRLHRLIRAAARFVMLRHGIPGVRFTYDTDPQADLTRPSIITCNHQSHLDLFAMLIFTPRIVFLTNDWVWRNPTYGFLIRHAEYLPASRGLDALLPQMQSLRDRGYSIAVFPEGTRSTDGRIGRFHQGALYLARELGMPLQPMVLAGAGDVLRKRTYHLAKGHIHISVAPTIPNDKLEAMGDTRTQARRLRQWYQKQYQQLLNRLARE